MSRERITATALKPRKGLEHSPVCTDRQQACRKMFMPPTARGERIPHELRLWAIGMTKRPMLVRTWRNVKMCSHH